LKHLSTFVKKSKEISKVVVSKIENRLYFINYFREESEITSKKGYSPVPKMFKKSK